MTRYLLDTNIISDVTKPAPSDALAGWVVEQQDSDLYISTLTIGEIHRGVLTLPAGRRRARLEAWFLGPEGPRTLFAGRVLPFDESAALVWGRLIAEGQRAGKPRSPLDMIVAAVAVANDCVIVTSNEKDFVGLTVLNPMHSSR